MGEERGSYGGGAPSRAPARGNAPAAAAPADMDAPFEDDDIPF
jgi:single-strand DNA-binding protein